MRVFRNARGARPRRRRRGRIRAAVRLPRFPRLPARGAGLPPRGSASAVPASDDGPGSRRTGRLGRSGGGHHRVGHGPGTGSLRGLWPFGTGDGPSPFRPGDGLPPGPGGGRPSRAVLAGIVCLTVALVVGAVLWAVGSGGAGEEAAGRGITRPEQSRSARAHQAPKPVIVPRERWAHDTVRSRPPARYDDRVLAVFVHHTDSPNGYGCADTSQVIRGLYTGQTEARNWDDIGYNFLVDRCGTIYEGRAGGVDRAVTGAHTQGFNHRTAGIAAIGTFTAGAPVPQAMTDAIAALAAWKLGLSGVDPRGGARLTSTSDRSRYPAGTTAMLPALAGHTDGFMTSCPGAALAERLPAIREAAARLQGRL